MGKKMIWFIIIGVVILGAVLLGPIISRVEQANYVVVKTAGAIETRDYAPKIIAQTQVSGARQEAISKGFRAIADFIFGNNTASAKVSMTAPVMQQQQSEKIAMTAPVMQQAKDGDKWTVAFVMPDKYTMETLPKPNNDAVTLIQIPEQRFIVIRFSGRATDKNIQNHTDKLNAYIKNNNIEAISAPQYAFYNPPLTLPFMRRNEIMREIAK